jgi:transcription antitermination factor NusG
MLSWYALHVRHDCEQLVTTALAGHCETFWPHRETRGNRIIRRAWFPGYMFVRADWSRADHRARVLGVSHVLGILGANGKPIAIPDQEIDSLRILMTQRAGVMLHRCVRIGERVRVTTGKFTGVEGILLRFGGARDGALLVVQIELLGQAVSAHLPAEAIESLAPIPRAA